MFFAEGMFSRQVVKLRAFCDTQVGLHAVDIEVVLTSLRLQQESEICTAEVVHCHEEAAGVCNAVRRIEVSSLCNQ